MTTEADPIERFEKLLASAWEAGAKHAHAMSLATVSAGGQPSSRMVVLAGLDQRGFVFYSNAESRKGIDLAANPRCSLTFYWRELDAQVTVQGSAGLVDEEEADAYFAARDRISRWGAWASKQSRVMRHKSVLIARVARIAARYPKAIPRPPHFVGFRVVPEAIEFWREGTFRLHERTRYRRSGSSWTVETLYP